MSDRVLPEDIPEKDFDVAVEEFRKIVGNEHVHLGSLVDGDYRNHPKSYDLYYLLEQQKFVASAVVRPANTEDVQAIVKVANTYKIPLWITSMGRNLGYGGAARISML